MTLSIENLIGVVTIILVIIASHARLESRLTRLETQSDERRRSDDEWRRRVEDRIARLEERRA